MQGGHHAAQRTLHHTTLRTTTACTIKVYGIGTHKMGVGQQFRRQYGGNLCLVEHKGVDALGGYACHLTIAGQQQPVGFGAATVGKQYYFFHY